MKGAILYVYVLFTIKVQQMSKKPLFEVRKAELHAFNRLLSAIAMDWGSAGWKMDFSK